MRVALVLALLLFLPVVSAAGDPGARSPIVQSATVRDVGLAVDNGLIGVSTNDPGSRVPVPPLTSDDDADVWFIYSKDGRTLMQEGDADIPACDSSTTPTADDCNTPATVLAIDSTGQHMVVGSVVSGTHSELIFVDRLQGDVHQQQLEGTIQDVAISASGHRVAAVTSAPTATGTEGDVYYFAWSSTAVTTPWGTGTNSMKATTSEGATDVAMASDGSTFVVAAGGSHYRFSHTTRNPTADSTFPGVANDVAISNSARDLSVAVSSQGWFQLYQDNTAAERRELRARDSETALTAAAMREDGTAMAVGNSDGDVWVYGIDPVLPSLKPLVGSVEVGASVRDIAFSTDGLNLVVTAADDIYHYAVLADDVVLLWEKKDLGTAASGRVAIDATGATVATASGNNVLLFDAVRSVAATTDTTVTLRPGVTEILEVDVKNTGNRLESLTFSTSPPGGWGVTMDPASADLAPGENVTVNVVVTVPDYEEPGSHDLPFKYDRTSDATPPATAATIRVSVPTIESWEIEPLTPGSKNIAAGASASFIVQISNLGNVAGTPDTDLTIEEEGWTAEFADFPGTIEPGVSTDYEILITAPATAVSGDSATAELKVAGAEGSPLDLTATVDARFGVEVTVTPAAIELAPDNETTLAVTVRNTGNAQDSFGIEVDLPDGWTATFPEGSDSHDVRDVAPGATKTMNLVIHSPDDEDADAASLVVQATSEADPTKKGSDTVDLSIMEIEEEEEDKGGDGDNGAPFPPLAFVGAVLLVAAFLKRRR